MIFKDRVYAGEKLARHLEEYKEKKDAIILAIPRGGVIIGQVMSRKLHLPLDVLIVKKVGAFGNPEFAVGAIDEEGNITENEDIISDKKYLEQEIKKVKAEIERRNFLYRGKAPGPVVEGRTVILVDDGIATGLTAISAINFIRNKNPNKIIIASPVIALDTYDKLRKERVEIKVLEISDSFYAVGQFYETFEQVTDKEVKEALSKSKRLE